MHQFTVSLSLYEATVVVRECIDVTSCHLHFWRNGRGLNDLLPGCLFAVAVIKCFMTGVNVWWVYLAPENIPRAISVLTLGNKVVLYFTSYGGNTEVERTSKWESAQKVDHGEENSPAAHTGTRTREVSITSTALYHCLLRWIWLVWPCSFFRKLQTLGVVWEINQKSRSFRSKCRRQMHCSRQKHTKRHRQTGGQTDTHTQTDRGRGLTITYHVVLCFGYVLVDEDCWCLGLHKLNCITFDFKYKKPLRFSYER